MAIDELKSIVDDSLDKLCNDKLSDNFAAYGTNFEICVHFQLTSVPWRTMMLSYKIIILPSLMTTQ